MDKYKLKTDIVHKGFKIYEHQEAGNREEHNIPQNYPSEQQTKTVQEEEQWKTQRRKNTNPQKVEYHVEKITDQHHNAEIGIISIPTINTYIILGVL